MKRLWVGVDGGGSKTDVLVLDASVDPPSAAFTSTDATNPNTVGWALAVSRLVDAVAEGAARLGGALEDVTGLCAAMAGAGNKALAARLQSALADALPNAVIRVVPDPLAALWATLPAESGIVLVAGTGSVAMGTSPDGRIVRAGGYGYLFSDEGSGFWIGRRCLEAAVAAFEGRGPQTVLWEVASTHYGVKHPSELVPLIYGGAHPVAAVSAFTPMALAHIEADAIVRNICQQAVECHLGLIRSVWHQLCEDSNGAGREVNDYGGLERDGAVQLPVVVGGGLYKNATMWALLQNAAPHVNARPVARPPVTGALLGAMMSATDPVAMRQHWQQAMTQILFAEGVFDDAVQ